MTLREGGPSPAGTATADVAAEHFGARLAALEDQLERVTSVLEVLSTSDARLYGRVAVRFTELLERCERNVQSLRAEARRPTRETFRALRKTRDLCESLFQECLAFSQGALVRRAEIDDGVCEIADKLLDDLDARAEFGWGRLTVLAETDFYGQVAQIVRLRFPEVTVWTLPVAVHEFGHFVAPRIRVDVQEGSFWDVEYPFKAILRREYERDPSRWHHMHEYFADVFATYVVGPAFPYACVALRFDLATAHRDSGWHPGPMKRFHVMRRTLAELDSYEPPLTSPYPPIIADLERRWASGRQAVGNEQDLSEAATAELGAAFDDVYPLLAESVPAIRYKTLTRARTFIPRLLEDGELVIPPDLSLADVLNAAWLARVENAGNDDKLVRRIGERALEACRRL